MLVVILFLVFNFSYRLGYDKAVAESAGKNFTKKDFKAFLQVWSIIKDKYVDPAKVDSDKAIFEASRGLIKSLGDPYSDLFSPRQAKIFNEDLSGSFGGVGFEIGIRNGILTVIAPLEGTPAARAGFKPGDKILKINGEITENMSVEEAVSKIRGKPGTKVTLTIFRDSWVEAKDFEIIREVINIPAIKSKLLESNIGYIKITSFGSKTYREFNQAFFDLKKRGADRFIIDLRNNPGGFLSQAIVLSELFLERGKVIMREKRRLTPDRPLLSDGPGNLSREKIVILINKGSASAAEIFAAALRDNLKIKLIGEKSFGKGTVQELFNLKGSVTITIPNGLPEINTENNSDGSNKITPFTKINTVEKSVLKLTVAYWLTPNGVKLEENGLIPDIEVKDTLLEDQTTTTDAVLDKALKVIKNI